jgi:hypothetical protein
LLLKAIEQLGAAEQKFPPDVWVTYNAQVLEAARPALKTFRQALAYPHWRVVDPTNFFSPEVDCNLPSDIFASLPAFCGQKRYSGSGRAMWMGHWKVAKPS